MEMSGELHAPAALPPGNSPPYPLDRRLVFYIFVTEQGDGWSSRSYEFYISVFDYAYIPAQIWKESFNLIFLREEWRKYRGVCSS
jgi:hypothetical protein